MHEFHSINKLRRSKSNFLIGLIILELELELELDICFRRFRFDNLKSNFFNILEQIKHLSRILIYYSYQKITFFLFLVVYLFTPRVINFVAWIAGKNPTATNR